MTMAADRNAPGRQRVNTREETAHVSSAANVPACMPDIDHLSVYTVTVGERGQVVLPADIRRQFKLQAHDKVLIFRHPSGMSTLALLQLKDFGDYIQYLNER